MAWMPPPKNSTSKLERATQCHQEVEREATLGICKERIESLWFLPKNKTQNSEIIGLLCAFSLPKNENLEFRQLNHCDFSEKKSSKFRIAMIRPPKKTQKTPKETPQGLYASALLLKTVRACVIYPFLSILI